LKIVTVIGARPQFVKAAALSRAIAHHNIGLTEAEAIREVIVHTGQHYDANMSQVFFDELQIPAPDYHLEVGSGRHGEQTGAMLARIEEVLLQEKPDFLLVYGDTNSTLAGALAAAKLHIPSVHVEAGLRSFNRRMPEEINRIIADQICTFLLCPTAVAVENLQNEGVGNSDNSGSFDFNKQYARLVGDVMYDSIVFNAQLAETKSEIIKTLCVGEGGFVLATLHRAENTDDSGRLQNILDAFNKIAATGISLILPLHPRTLKRIAELNLSDYTSGIKIIEPVGYLDMLQLEKSARVIVTDSGGVQKEAFLMGVPCITLREETEWTETVDLGWNSLVGADTQMIAAAFTTAIAAVKGETPFFCDSAMLHSSLDREHPYGDGHAAELIVNILAESSLKGWK